MLMKRISENLVSEKGALRILGVWDTKMTNGSTMKPHHHTDVEELFYILEGSGTIIIGDEEMKVVQGDLIYIPPKQIHTISHRGKKPLRFITLSIFIGKGNRTKDTSHYIT